MDFLDPQKKRAHLIRLYIGYALITVILGIVSYFLMYAAGGYDINRHTGEIFQNGLIIVDAHPAPATIYINNVDKGTTNNRLVLPEAKYDLELRAKGYRNWKHTVNLEGSTIEQLVYPFLFPSNLITKPIHEFTAAPDMAIESPDRHWLMTHSPPSQSDFNVVDLSNNKNPSTTLSLPNDVLTAVDGVQSFEAIEWSSDNVHLLLKHTFSGGSEFVLLNRELPSSSVNLTKLFGTQSFTNVSLRDKKADQFYLFNEADGNLFQADVKTKIPALVLSKVLSYKSYQADILLYVTNPAGSATSVDVRVYQGKDDHLLRTLPIATTYLLDIAQFDGRFYIVCGSQADSRTYVYKDPLDDLNHRPLRTPLPFRVLVVPSAQYVSFSANTRFMAVQGSSNFAVYDAETGRQARYDTKLVLEPNQKATWMDGHRLTIVSGQKVAVFDFDGTNMQTLSASLPNFTAFFDRDYTSMYAVAPPVNATAKNTIARTELVVK